MIDILMIVDYINWKLKKRKGQTLILAFPDPSGNIRDN